jgi:molecular chaperone DnaK (HSP70)
VAESLGIDLGTTYTAAAVVRDGRAEVLPLGNRATAIPTLVFLREDETLLVGEAAERRGITEPQRLAREFKRRFGDTNPILLGPSPYSADRLAAHVLRWVLDTVNEREAGVPKAIALAHPANWGNYKVDLIRQAAVLSGISHAVLVREPVAAALYYASTERMDPGDTVAVYDLGGGTFDAAIVRRTEDGFDLLGRPEGIERLGGIDFDNAILEHVRASLGDHAAELDADDPASRALRARLRQECVAAKEALSTETDTTVHVPLSTGAIDLRLTRDEFESMIRPLVRETINALTREIESAGLEPGRLRSVLLVGGSSRIPLIGEMVTQALDRPVAVDAHPKLAVALGTALYAQQVAGTTDASGGAAVVPGRVAPVTDDATTAAAPAGVATAVLDAPTDDEPPAREAVDAPAARVHTTATEHEKRRGRVPLVLVAALVLVVALGGGAYALFGGGGGGGTNADVPSCKTASKRCIVIDRVEEAGTRYAVHYAANTGSGAHRGLRFYWEKFQDFARTSTLKDGEPRWWDEPAINGKGVFEKPKIQGRGDSTKFCAGVLDDKGAFDRSSEVCAPLPAQ